MKREQKVRELLRRKYPNETVLYNYRPDWLRNPRTGYNLELDIYYPGLKLAVEVNGIHHETMYQQYKDGIKHEACKARGITLECIIMRNRSIKAFIAKYGLDPKGLGIQRFGAGTPRKGTKEDRYVQKVERQLVKDHYAMIYEIQRKETERIRNVRGAVT